MSQPDFVQRIAEAAAGRALPQHVSPPAQEYREPPQPTTSAVVSGIRLAPASRLAALAAIRDGHRGAARAANDKMHEHRESVEAYRRRLRLLTQYGEDLPAHVATQAAQIEAQIEATTAARAAAFAEAEAAAAAAASADRLLKAALALCAKERITVPVLLAQEAQNA